MFDRFLEREESPENGPLAEKMTRQKEQEELGRKARMEDRRVESNDSPEIPHRGEKEERK